MIHDPAIIDFLHSQNAWPTGHKRYSPVPRSRIPATPRTARSGLRARSVPVVTSPLRHPLYTLFVRPGQEIDTAQRIRHAQPHLTAFVPVTPDNRPQYPGWVFVAIPDTAYGTIRTLAQDFRWGVLGREPVEPDLADRIRCYAAALPDDPDLVPDAEHPLWRVGEALAHSEGLHGPWRAHGWDLVDVTGRPAESVAFTRIWDALRAAWRERPVLEDVLASHADQLIGRTFPVAIQSRGPGPWDGVWFGQPVRIPGSDHAGIQLKAPRVSAWGVLTGGPGPWTMSLTHPRLTAGRLAYRVPVLDTIRVPGRWAVVQVPQVTETVRMHVRHTAQQLGWRETWSAVSADDPAGLVRQVLTPHVARFDPDHPIVRLVGVPKDRQRWIPRVERWIGRHVEQVDR